MSRGNGHLREFSNGLFRLDVGKKVLWYGEQPVQIPLKAIELLSVLIERKGEVVTKEEIWRDVWQDSFVEETNLTHNIYLLRKTLKDLGAASNLIQTVPRRGYRFTGEVQAVSSNDEFITEKHNQNYQLTKGEKSDAPNSTSQVHQLSKNLFLRNYRFAVFSAVLLVAVISVLAFSVYQNKLTKTSAVEIKSIAVLPLKSFDSENENEELRLRITDALITKLGDLHGISVRPTNSVLSFTKKKQDVIAVGEKLEVDAVLDGRVQIEGKRLRVTMQLVSVQNGEQIWSGIFDGKTDEILNLQDKIAAQLMPRLSPMAVAANPTTNSEAFENYLKGRYLWNKRISAEMQKSVPYFEKAIMLDPNFAPAYAGLADTYSMLTNHGYFPTNEGYAKAKSLAKKALEINPNLSEAHSALGWILYEHEWNWAEAEKNFARAIELNPNNAEAHHWRALNFLAVGKTEEYFDEIEKAHSLAPLTKPIEQSYYYAVFKKKGCAKAADYLEEIFALNQFTEVEETVMYGFHYSNCNEYEKVIAKLEKVSNEKRTSKMQAYLGAAYAKTGKRRQALEIIELLKKNNSTIKYFLMPYIYVALGDFDSAFANLEKGVSARDDRSTKMKYDDFLKPLHSDARFKELLKKMNLPE